jgi:DNA primase
MFPITDLRGRVVAFGGRALEKDVPAKYLNSPETSLFHKGGMLYNAATARAATHQDATLIAVEGYVDVIAMVTAGFEATVAPLGTALTEDQLALLWKMSDEPILCFDGDKAGRRAAYRAVDLALPHLKPGKSLKFATLPEGQDPDDLVRSGGREAIEEVIAGAQPLAAVVWMRETEPGGFDTPERRAALEARIAEISATIRDDAVRKYYRQDLESRLRSFFAPDRGVAFNRQERPRFGLSRGERGARSNFAGTRFPSPHQALALLSPRLATSPIVRGSRSGLPAREALILLAVINHPQLLETHGEDFAHLEFRHPDAASLRSAILDAASDHASSGPVELRDSLKTRNYSQLLVKVDNAVTHMSDWPARAGAAAEDVDRWWTHVVTLHRKTGTLHKELKDAEQALGNEPSEANLAWLRDVQERLAAVDGSEALIEGFGALSGRGVRSF